MRNIQKLRKRTERAARSPAKDEENQVRTPNAADAPRTKMKELSTIDARQIAPRHTTGSGAIPNAFLQIWKTIDVPLRTSYAEKFAELFGPDLQKPLWDMADLPLATILPIASDGVDAQIVQNLLHDLAEARHQIAQSKVKMPDASNRRPAPPPDHEPRAFTSEYALLYDYKEELEKSLTNFSDELSSVYKSTSWTLTQWLRDLGTLAKGARGRSAKLESRQGPAIPRKIIFPAPNLQGGLEEKLRSLKDRLPPQLQVIAIGDGPIPSIELGLNIPLQHLVEDDNLCLRIAYESELPLESDLLNADVVFLKRVCSDKIVALVRLLKHHNVPVVYMIDDDYSEISPETPLGQRYREMNAWPNVEKLTRLADYTVVWSPGLESKLRPHSNRLVRFYAPSNVEIFNKLKRPSEPRLGLTFGYAGGSSHAPDLELVREPLLKFLANHPDARFESIGLEIEWLKDHSQYTFIKGSSNLKEYYQILLNRQWSWAIVPLADSRFNTAKSDNKFRELAAAKIPGLYSNVLAYQSSIENNYTGVLVNNSDDAWYDAMELFSADESLRKRIVGESAELAAGRYGQKNVDAQYRRLISSLVPTYHVLAVGPTKIPSFGIDIDGPFRILAERNIAKLRSREIEAVTKDDLLWANTLVVVRMYTPAARELIEEAKRLGIKTIYSWDDNWLDYPDDGTELAADVRAPVNQKALKDILTSVSYVRATTPPIYDASAAFNSNVEAFHYGFDFDLTQNRRPSFRRDGKVRVGFFGTPGRDNQFHNVIEGIKLAQAKHKNIHLEFFGFNPARAGELHNVTLLPYMGDYETSVRELAKRKWDIGLAPLSDSKFNDSKLPTKYRDYAAVGAAGIYSTGATYKDVVRDYVNGIFAENSPESWAKAIDALVSNDELRERIVNNSTKHVYDELSVKFAADHWEALLAKAYAL